MLLIGVLVAVAAAAANALGSVLQRSASRHHEPGGGRRRALLELLRRPAWSAGIGAHVVGFALQAVALTLAAISVVQPVLIVELPFTLVLSALLLRTPMGRRAWTAIAAMALGLALLLFCLVPAGGDPGATSGVAWLVGTAIVLAVVGVGTLVATRALAGGSRPARSALTAIGIVLAVAGLVQLTFLGVGGVYFVAFAAGALLLHLPAARSFFAPR